MGRYPAARENATARSAYRTSPTSAVGLKLKATDGAEVRTRPVLKADNGLAGRDRWLLRRSELIALNQLCPIRFLRSLDRSLESGRAGTLGVEVAIDPVVQARLYAARNAAVDSPSRAARLD